MDLQIEHLDGLYTLKIVETGYPVGSWEDEISAIEKYLEVSKAYFIEERDGKFCVVKGSRDDPQGTEKCHETKADASAHLRALYANVSDAKKVDTTASDNISGNLMHGDADEDLNPGREHTCTCPECGAKKDVALGTECSTVKCPECGVMMKKSVDSHLSVYKAGDTWRWQAVSNVAILDREYEIITEKAYDDAIDWAKSTGMFGELDLVHVDGTDVGDCDFQQRVGSLLIEGGTWRDTPLATRVRKEVTRLGDEAVSIKFVYDPAQFDGVRYNGGIRILKRTILPRDMAASFGTTIAVVPGGEEMSGIDEKARAALRDRYGYTDEDIDALAEKQVVLENVKEKELDKETIGIFAKAVNALLGKNRPKEEEVPEVKEVVPEVKEPDGVPLDEVVKSLTPIISQAIIEALGPVQEALSGLESWKASIETGLAESAKDVETKANELLAETPPIVRAPVTMARAAVLREQVRSGGVNVEAKALVADITEAVNSIVSSKLGV